MAARSFRTIVITGASSGIGAALARAYAGPETTLHLTGRSEERLEALAQELEAKGSRVTGWLADVRGNAEMAEVLERIWERGAIDLLVANAGISGGTHKKESAVDPRYGGEAMEQARAIFETNLAGVLNTLEPVMGRMAERGEGQIGLMSSLAGFVGFPAAPAYCASKAAVRVYGEALRALLAPSGVGVSVICPGYVRTPMTEANALRMPLLMEPDRAARIIRRGLARNRARIAFPLRLYLGVRLAESLPAWITARLAGRRGR